MNKTARIVVGLAFAVAVLLVLVWITCKDRITFYIDRRTVENTLRIQGHSVDEQSFDTNSIGTGRVLFPESIPKPDMELSIEGRTFHFFGSGVARRQDSPSAFNSPELLIFLFDSFANDLQGPPPELGGAAAQCLRSFIQSTDPFDLLKQIHCARLSAIDAGPDLCSKYRALYLYSMRKVCQWKDVEEMREIHYPRHKILLQKVKGGRKWLATVYFPDHRTFVDVNIILKTEVPSAVVESILASFTIEGPTR